MSLRDWVFRGRSKPHRQRFAPPMLHITVTLCKEALVQARITFDRNVLGFLNIRQHVGCTAADPVRVVEPGDGRRCWQGCETQGAVLTFRKR